MNKATDNLFRIGLIVKGVDSLFEVLGGVLLSTPTRLARYLDVLAEHEIYKHHQVMAGRIDKLAENVTAHANVGEAIYLLVHGLAKVILIAAVFRGKKWGYTGLMGVLSFFTVVELSRAALAHEVVTAFLGLFDIAVVILIWKEYKARFGKTQEMESGPAEEPVV